MDLLGWWSEKRRGRLPDSKRLLADLDFTVLDTELTGLDDRRDDIVSIGALRMHGGRIELGNTFQALVRPRAVLDGRTVVVHRITPSQLEAAPLIEEVLPPFLDYLAETVLLGHCISLDLAFLNRDAKRVVGAALRNRAVDTLSLYGWLRHRHSDHPAFTLELTELNLFNLATAFEIPIEKAHTALGDAYITAQVFQRLLPFLIHTGVRDLAGLRRVGDPQRQTTNLVAPAGHAHF